MTTSRLRTDIQFLRGYAVLAVVLYHAKIGLFASGFLGVDIFFVISGFLITGLIARGIEDGSFRVAGFYFRRAKRLLPAAYVTFAVVAALAPILLTSSEMRDFVGQLGGALTFTANVVLWRQSGYFEGDAELKPLLHVWSLSVEEQYYFLVPALMLFVSRRFWLAGTVATLIVSLGLRIGYAEHQAAVFYLLPARAWELMIGGAGALLVPSARGQAFVRVAFWPAFAAMLVVPVTTFGRSQAVAAMLIVCLATLIVILRCHPFLARSLPMRGVAWVGDRSYSLYLVHWPLFAFFANVWVSGPESLAAAIRLALIPVSLAFAHLLYRYVEAPLHRASVARPARFVAGLAAVPLALFALTFGVSRAVVGDTDYAYLRRINQGFGPVCESVSDFRPLAACRNSQTPEFLVWGDSFAMHLVPGLLASDPPPALVQATRSVCGPILGLALAAGDYDRAWAERCIRFNDSVIDYLKSAGSVGTVVLSSPFNQLIGTDVLVRAPDGTLAPARGDIDIALRAMKHTVDTLRAIGKKVVVVAPPPHADFDVARCLERRDSDRLTIGGACDIDLGRYRARQAAVLAFLAALPAKADVNVVGFDSFLCGAERCRTSMDGIMLYRDRGHFSHAGARYIARRMHLVEEIRQKAR